MGEQIRIEFGPETSIALTLEKTWEPSSDEAEPLARIANVLSLPPFYEYSPAHGAFGPLLARRIAKRIGGRVILPKTRSQPRPPAGIVF